MVEHFALLCLFEFALSLISYKHNCLISDLLVAEVVAANHLLVCQGEALAQVLVQEFPLVRLDHPVRFAVAAEFECFFLRQNHRLLPAINHPKRTLLLVAD